MIAPGQYVGLPHGRQDDTHYVDEGARRVARLALDLLHTQRPELRAWLK